MTPETRYAKSGDVHIAYQVVGDGPIDLVFVPGWITHLELAWETRSRPLFLRRLASFLRLILFDKRGTGLSDRVPVNELRILEERMDDVRAVMDAGRVAPTVRDPAGVDRQLIARLRTFLAERAPLSFERRS